MPDISCYKTSSARRSQWCSWASSIPLCWWSPPR